MRRKVMMMLRRKKRRCWWWWRVEAMMMVTRKRQKAKKLDVSTIHLIIARYLLIRQLSIDDLLRATQR